MENEWRMLRRRQAYREFKDRVSGSCVRLAEEWSRVRPLMLEGQMWLAGESQDAPYVKFIDSHDPADGVWVNQGDIREIAEWLLSLIGERIEERHEEGADGQ